MCLAYKDGYAVLSAQMTLYAPWVSALKFTSLRNDSTASGKKETHVQ